jgi:hypothetical protein
MVLTSEIRYPCNVDIADPLLLGDYDFVTTHENYVRFEVFTAVTMKNCVLWDITSCGSCKNRRFGGT